MLRFNLRSRVRLLRIYIKKIKAILFGDETHDFHGLDAAISNYSQSFETSKSLVNENRDLEGCLSFLKMCSYDSLQEINTELTKYYKKVINQSNKEKSLIFRFEELLKEKSISKDKNFFVELQSVISQIKNDFTKLRDLNKELKNLIDDIRNQKQRINSYNNLRNIDVYILKQCNISDSICHKLRILEKRFESWFKQVSDYEKINEKLVKELVKSAK